MRVEGFGFRVLGSMLPSRTSSLRRAGGGGGVFRVEGYEGYWMTTEDLGLRAYRFRFQPLLPLTTLTSDCTQ